MPLLAAGTVEERHPLLKSLLSPASRKQTHVPGARCFLSLVENGFELKVRTCDEIGARTEDILNISFCAGGNTCTSGPANPYNVHHEVYVNGGSAVFTVPLDYEPTTMQISKGLHDAW